MYSIVNNVKNMEDLEKIKSIIQSRLRKISEADDDNKKDEKKSMIDLYPAYARNRKVSRNPLFSKKSSYTRS